jgi:adenylylsulfate kinase
MSDSSSSPSPPSPGLVVWLFGLSGSGKSTLSKLLEAKLQQAGHRTALLDGDAIRSGLNRDLGFSDADRHENIRRASEVAKLIQNLGMITIVAFITPREELRELAKEIIGPNLITAWLKCSFQTCAQRDVKGLYAKAARNEVKQFTGKDSLFEEARNCDLVLDTEHQSPEECIAALEAAVAARLASAR